MRTKAWKIDMEGKKPLKTLCPQALMALQTCLIHIIFGETQDQLCCHLQTSAGSDCGSSKLVPYLQCQLSHPAARIARVLCMSAKYGYCLSCVDATWMTKNVIQAARLANIDVKKASLP